MARTNNKEAKKSETKNYKVFNLTGAHGNDFSGRIYLEPITSNKGSRYGLSITINGITIKGAKLWIPDDENKACSILWPSYKDKDGEYQSYIIFFEADDREDIRDLVDIISDLV